MLKRKFDYENKEYLEKLNALQPSYYSKYLKKIKEYSPSKTSKILEVGCGNGSNLTRLNKWGYKNTYGIDISKLFIKEAKRRGLKNVYSYNGEKLPFSDNYFDLISSFNVLEHVENPKQYLGEQVKKLKKEGVIILGCPNFLSIIHQANHPQLKGTKQKIRNIITVLSKLVNSKNLGFKKMKPILRKKFEYDDDAIVVTNLIDLRSFFKNNKCAMLYESGFINYDTLIYKVINKIPIVKYLLPSCFIVVKKI